MVIIRRCADSIGFNGKRISHFSLRRRRMNTKEAFGFSCPPLWLMAYELENPGCILAQQETSCCLPKKPLVFYALT